jgi:hypothetical protein
MGRSLEAKSCSRSALTSLIAIALTSVAAFGGESLLGPVDASGHHAAVVARTGGGYAAAWRDEDGVRFRVLDAEGRPTSDLKMLATAGSAAYGALDVGATSDSGFVVVWAAGAKLWSIRCDASAACSDAALIGAADRDIFYARIQTTPRGHLVAYVKPRPNPDSSDFGALVLQRLDGSARAIGAPRTLTPPGRLDYEPDLRVTAQGGYVVAWSRWGGEARFGDVFVQSFTAHDRPRGDARSLRVEFREADQGFPAVFLRPDGSGAVVIVDHEEQLTAQDFDRRGGLASPARAVLVTNPPRSLAPPQVVVGADDEPLAVVHSVGGGLAVALFGGAGPRAFPGHAGRIARSAVTGDHSSVVVWFAVAHGAPRGAVRAQRIEVP